MSHLSNRMRHLRQTPPENAIKTLKALVFLDELSSDLRAFKIPTMTTRTRISPVEQTANATLEIRLRCNDSSSACSSSLVHMT